MLEWFSDGQLRAVEILCPLGLGVCCLSRGLGFWLSYASMVVALADANVCAMVCAMFSLQRLE